MTPKEFIEAVSKLDVPWEIKGSCLYQVGLDPNIGYRTSLKVNLEGESMMNVLISITNGTQKSHSSYNSLCELYD